jgi:hypothetical protein
MSNAIEGLSCIDRTWGYKGMPAPALTWPLAYGDQHRHHIAIAHITTAA